jgi:Zn-dependent peptidase ImmA (M78 family)/DNA-binding XRE family transcriptional regulator
MTVTKEFNGDRLKSARIYRGKTIAALAEEMPQESRISKQAISLFENNKANPGFETLFQLTSILGFPREYFYEKDVDDVKVGNTYFRALLSTNNLDRLSQIEKTKILARIYHFLNNYIEFPRLNLPKIDIEIEDVEIIASKARDYWGLGNEPILNMVKLLEKNGLIVSSFSTDGHFIDAFSQRQEINDIIYYFIILGNDKNSASRRQFDAAHELGHILCHDWSLDLEQISRDEFRQIETEANKFAAAFLLPRDSFINDLIYPNKLEFYVDLKKKWKVSISAMIVRAYHLNVINNNQYQYLMRQISKNGWRSKEPLDDIIQVPKPTLFKKAIELLMVNDVMAGDQILKELSNYKLSLDRKEVETLLELDEGTLINKKQVNPVISIKKNQK